MLVLQWPGDLCRVYPPSQVVGIACSPAHDPAMDTHKKMEAKYHREKRNAMKFKKKEVYIIEFLRSKNGKFTNLQLTPPGNC